MAHLTNKTSKLIKVRSIDRIDANNNSETTFSVDLGTGSDIHKVQRIVLRSAHFVNNFYNIQNVEGSTTGINIFIIEIDAVIYQVDIPIGFYSLNQLITFIENDINPQISPQTLTITQSDTTGILSFTLSAGVCTVAFFGGVYGASVVLGATQDKPASNPYVLDRIPTLQGKTRLLLRSRELSPANSVDSEQDLDNLFLNIPITAPYKGTNHYEPFDDELASIVYKTPRDLRFIDIDIVDEYENPVDNNGLPVELVFKVYFK